MKSLKTVRELQSALAEIRENQPSIGFVPTMGALHKGHLELVRQSVAENDATVVSIFVNPTQFNDPNDLLRYPRTLEADCKLLESAGATLVFAPSVEEIYPEPDSRQFDFGALATVMEGEFRPGHFNGVAQVVSRLFALVQPTRAYFGEKDFQQLAIIRALVEQLGLPIEIRPHPIVREDDGLAMSSRNVRLSPELRQRAASIHQILQESLQETFRLSPEALEEAVIYCIDDVPGLQTEYFEVVDGYTLQPVNDWHSSSYIVGCIAVYAGEVRLIDNITYVENKN
jgi:pantoate--beta-alanine ligase